MTGTPHLAVISARRPGTVPAMTAAADDLPLTWYVADGEAPAYRAAGATDVVEAGTLCRARNAALDDAAATGTDCVQLSDDLRSLGWAHGGARSTRDTVEQLTVAQAVDRLAETARFEDAWLAGAMPTSNPYFAGTGVQRRHFIVGDLIWVRAGCPLRFDEELQLKEDYDYTCQHLAAYGRVARLGQLMGNFAHRTNPGGAVAYRNTDTEQTAISYLKTKWPGVLVDNPRRPNEVLLRWK